MVILDRIRRLCVIFYIVYDRSSIANIICLKFGPFALRVMLFDKLSGPEQHFSDDAL